MSGCRNRWIGQLHKDQDLRKKNGSRWEEWEERLLVSGFYACLGWEAIAKSIPGRTKFGAKSHWAEYFRAPDRDEPWTSGELALLTRLRDEGSGWDEICQAIPGHTVNACRTQWYKEAEGIQESEDIRGSKKPRPDAWSAEEADTLMPSTTPSVHASKRYANISLAGRRMHVTGGFTSAEKKTVWARPLPSIGKSIS